MSANIKNVIFVDGANVAKEYQPGKTFSVLGLLRCAVYFQQRQFQPRIILHRNYRALASTGRLEDGDQLMKLEAGENGFVVFTPIGVDEKEFLVQLAFDHGGIVVSNDTFESEKNKRQDWNHFLARRRLSFQFIHDEFGPLPPTVNGQIMDIEDFLRSNYEVGKDFSTAAALTDYLLSMKVQESADAPPTTESRPIQRPRTSRSSQLRRYSVGQIVEVTSERVSVQFQTSKRKTAVTWFARDAYRPSGRAVHDLSREFRVNDWIGFISVKDNDRGWSIQEVRKKGEMRRGYGRFRPLAGNSSSGLIEARYKTEAGGGDVFFPGAAFREDGTLLQSLKRGHWLYYYAFDQKPSAGCTAVAVEVFSATAAGVVISKTPSHIFVWSAKTGIARGEAADFAEGTWVKFHFQQRTEEGRVRWIISNIEEISVPAGVKIETEQLEGSEESLVHIRCQAILGVLTESFGTIWTEAFGLMSLPTNCLKQISGADSAKLQPFKPVRFWAMYDGGHSEVGDGDGASTGHGSKVGEGGWRVLSLIPCNGTADSPLPPPSVIFGVEAAVLQLEVKKDNDRGQQWILMSEKWGKIVATPFDLSKGRKRLVVGERVKVTIVPQPLIFGDEYRALFVE